MTPEERIRMLIEAQRQAQMQQQAGVPYAAGLGAAPPPQQQGLGKFDSAMLGLFGGPGAQGLPAEQQRALAKQSQLALAMNLMKQSGWKPGPKSTMGGLGAAVGDTMGQTAGLGQQAFRNNLLKQQQEDMKTYRKDTLDANKAYREETAAARAEQLDVMRSHNKAIEEEQRSRTSILKEEAAREKAMFDRIQGLKEERQRQIDAGTWDPDNDPADLAIENEISNYRYQRPSAIDEMYRSIYGQGAAGTAGAPGAAAQDPYTGLNSLFDDMTGTQQVDPRTPEAIQGAGVQPGDFTDFQAPPVGVGTVLQNAPPVAQPAPAAQPNAQTGLGGYLMGDPANPINTGLANAFAGSGDKMSAWFRENGFAEPTGLGRAEAPLSGQAQAANMSQREVNDLDNLLRDVDEKARKAGKDPNLSNDAIRLRMKIQKMYESGDIEGARRAAQEAYG